MWMFIPVTSCCLKLYLLLHPLSCLIMLEIVAPILIFNFGPGCPPGGICPWIWSRCFWNFSVLFWVQAEAKIQVFVLNKALATLEPSSVLLRIFTDLNFSIFISYDVRSRQHYFSRNEERSECDGLSWHCFEVFYFYKQFLKNLLFLKTRVFRFSIRFAIVMI